MTPETERPSTHGKPHYRPSPQSGGHGVHSGLEQSQAAQQQYRSSGSRIDRFTRGWSGCGQLEKMALPTYWASEPKAPPASVPPPTVVCCVAHGTWATWDSEIPLEPPCLPNGMRKTISMGVRKLGFPAFELKPGLAKIFPGWPLLRTCSWPILLMMASTSPQDGVARSELLAYKIVLGPTTTPREDSTCF